MGGTWSYITRPKWHVVRDTTVETDCCDYITHPECPCCPIRKVKCTRCKLPDWIQRVTGLRQVRPEDATAVQKPVKLPEIPEKSEGQKAFPLSLKKFPIIWLMGGPASGRRTQGRMLAAHYNFQYIRWQALYDDQLPLGAPKLTRLLTLEEKLGRPPRGYVKFIKEEMAKGIYFHQGFIIQGCPINLEDARKFTKEIGEVSMIIYLEVCVADMRSRSEGYGELPRVNRYQADAGKRLFEREMFQFQTLGSEILKQFPTKVAKFDAELGSDELYVRCVESIDFMLRQLGLRVPSRSPNPKRKFKKPDFLEIIEDVRLLGHKRSSTEPSSTLSSHSWPLLTSTQELPLIGKYNFENSTATGHKAKGRSKSM